MSARSAKKKAATKEAALPPETAPEIVAYKGFDQQWRCRDYQYEIGKTYEHEHSGKVVRCTKGGFHSCEFPLDVFSYYEPAKSRYAEVRVGGKIDRSDEDTKIASGRITISAEIHIPKLIEAAIKWITDRCTPANAQHATGDRSASSATGYSSASSATGDRSASSATGDSSASSATGDSSASSATGDRSASSATGDRSASSATGYRSASSVDGDQAVAAAFGYQSKAKAGKGGAIVVAWWDKPAQRKRLAIGYVGEDGIKADTWYRVDDRGALVEDAA